MGIEKIINNNYILFNYINIIYLNIIIYNKNITLIKIKKIITYIKNMSSKKSKK